MENNLQKINIGKIVNVVGLKGELKVYHYSDYKERFEELDSIILKNKDEELEFKIKNVRYMQDMVILKLDKIDDRTLAEKYRNYEIYITENQLRELPEDTYYLRDLKGMICFDETSEKTFGRVKGVLQNSAQDIYVIKPEKGEDILIPAVKEFVKEVNVKEGKITFTLIKGFIDEAIEA